MRLSLSTIYIVHKYNCKAGFYFGAASYKTIIFLDAVFTSHEPLMPLVYANIKNNVYKLKNRYSRVKFM